MTAKREHFKTADRRLARLRAARRKRPVVNLAKQDGNAFGIIGACMRAGHDAGWDKAKCEEVRREMKSGNYDHLLQTAMKYFEVEYEPR